MERTSVLVAQVKEYVRVALIDLYSKDADDLIRREPDGLVCDEKCRECKYHVCERAIVFRFAHYLLGYIEKDLLFAGYSLDCDYNRNGSDKKSPKGFDNGTYPDIIIHKRKSNQCNLMVCEVKTCWNKDTTQDEKKITAFIKDTNYKYKLGLSLVIKKEEVELKWFDDKANPIPVEKIPLPARHGRL